MGKLYALLVGIDAYRAPLRPLAGCRNDVRLATALLRGRVEAADLNLHTLVDAEATRAALIDGFRGHLAQAGPGDTTLFWFSGHGSLGALPDGMPFAEAYGACQTLVCYDSRHGAPDLYDKELSRLGREIADRGAHLVSVLDCCHAESGMREAERDLVMRMAPPAAHRPDLAALLPVLTGGELVPGAHDPRQVTLAACQTFERAYETGGAGAFSRALVRAVAHLGGEATYREIMAVTRARVEGRYRRQTPVLEPREPGGTADLPFLGGLLRPPAAAVTMTWSGTGWTIDVGRLHGVGEAAETRYAVHGSAPLDEVRVTTVRIDRSVVEPLGWQPDPDRAHPMVLTRVPVPPVTVAVHGPDASALTRALAAAGPGGGPSPHVRVVSAADQPALRSGPAPGHRYLITSPDGEPLAPDAGLADTVRHLEHIARWLHVRNLDNPGSALRGAVRLDLIEAGPGETLLPDDDRPGLGPGPIVLAYRREAGGWLPPSVFIRLTNTLDRPLYCALLDLTDTHRIHAGLFPGEHLAARWSAAAGNGRPVRLTLPRDRVVLPGARVRDWFLLLVAEEPFSAESLLLPRLGEPHEPGRRAAAGLRGIPDRLGLAIARRDADAAPATASDWAVTVVEVETRIPAGEGQKGMPEEGDRMTACTERHPAAPADGPAGEGQKGMPEEGDRMTACTERHPAAPADGPAGEGQKGMPEEGSA